MKTIMLVIFSIAPLYSQIFISLQDTSTFQVEPYSDKLVSNGTKLITKNVAFRIPSGWNSNFVIKETICIKKVQQYEGNLSRTNLVAFSLEDKKETLWTIEDHSEKVFYHWMDLIETVKYGCCGASDTHTYYDLNNGNKILHCDSKLIYIKDKTNKTDLFFGFNSYSSVISSLNLFEKGTITGQLFYSNSKSCIDSLSFVFPESDVYIWPPEKIFLMDTLNNEVGEETYSDAISKLQIKDPINSFYFVIDYSDGNPIKIKIEKSRFNLEKSIIPDNILVDSPNKTYEPEYLNLSEFKLLENKSDEQLQLLRNEIYARNGYSFDSENLRSYFGSKDWYEEKPGYKVELKRLTNDENLFLKKILFLEKNSIK